MQVQSYLSQLSSLFSFGNGKSWRERWGSFKSQIWRHFLCRICATEVFKPEVVGDVTVTTKRCGIYPRPWRRFPCVTATPPSQHKTIWTGLVFDRNNTKASFLIRYPSVLSFNLCGAAVRVCAVANQTKAASKSWRCLCVKTREGSEHAHALPRHFELMSQNLTSH